VRGTPNRFAFAATQLTEPQRDFAKTKYNPTAVATPPPARNQIERSVGELVNTLEISEAVDCDSLKPKINNNKPATSKATPNALFIISFRSHHTDLLPLMMRTSNTTIAMTSRMWMNPPIV
jgi:hypothetical protein